LSPGEFFNPFYGDLKRARHNLRFPDIAFPKIFLQLGARKLIYDAPQLRWVRLDRVDHTGKDERKVYLNRFSRRVTFRIVPSNLR
jgi:hypothetical protein